MNFLDDSLFPENQEDLVITAAPYGPEWMPSDFPEDIPVTMDEHVQKAVDCYNAGATVLHLHVRELDGHGSKRLSMFNELLARLRIAVPDMVLQVGGSISFAPESEGAGGEVALRRRAPHAGRTEAAARSGDRRRQHEPVQRRGDSARRKTSPERRWASRRCSRPTARWLFPPAPAGSRNM